MTDTKANLRAFQLKGSLMTLTVLELLKADLPAVHAQFLSLVKQTPDLFRRMPIIVDLNKIQDATTPLDVASIFSLMREHGLIPIGVRGGNSEQQRAVTEAGLPILNNTKGEKHDAVHATNAASNKETAESTAPTKSSSKLITQPVRSGQQIYAKGGDLVILSSVSPGAEIVADGNIHIYGALRGRALAGVNGDKQARIFCQKLEAELVSIAGHYWINEDLSPLPDGQTVQVYLENDRLHIGTF